MENLPAMIVSTAAVAMLLMMSVRSFLFWQRQPGVRRLPVQVLEVSIGGAIFVILNFSVIFFDDNFSRPAVALIAAGTYYAFARLCSSVGRSVWRHKRFHTIALTGLMVAALGLAYAPISTPLLILIFALATYREQWRFADALARESIADLHSLHTKMRTTSAEKHNAEITEGLENRSHEIDDAS